MPVDTWVRWKAVDLAIRRVEPMADSLDEKKAQSSAERLVPSRAAKLDGRQEDSKADSKDTQWVARRVGRMGLKTAAWKGKHSA
jgi:hypothetical protein